MTPDRLLPLQLAAGRLGFAVDPEPVPPSVPASSWAFRDGRMIVDHLFLFDLDQVDLRQAHPAAWAWANSRFSVPRALRIRTPHTISVGLASGPVDPEVETWIHQQGRRPFVGGETRHVVAIAGDGLQHTQPAIGRVDRQSVAMTGILDIAGALAAAWLSTRPGA